MENDLKQLLLTKLKTKQNYKGLGYPSIIEELCESNDLKFEIDPEYNSWECDWWAIIYDSEKRPYCNVSGSMYYGTITLDFNID